MKRSRRQWKYRFAIAPMFEKYYWIDLGVGFGWLMANELFKLMVTFAKATLVWFGSFL